jgi:hypothetical protein
MKRNHDVRRLLRWYPASWRNRYGDEFLALLEDRLEEAPLTIRLRSSVVIAGLRERCYGSGMLGTRSSPPTQRRTGSLMVLVAWFIMIVGGASFVKMAEHFRAALPSSSRAVATVAYDTTALAGLLGTLFVVAGAIAAVPGFVRFLRENKWPEVFRTFVRSVVSSLVLVVATVGLASWARHLNTAQRNGGDHLYSGAFLAFALVVVITIGLWTRTGVAVASRIDFTPRELRRESYLAVAVSFASIVVVASAAVWGIQIGLHAPWFFNGTAAGVAASPWSAQVVATMLVMTLATATALWGATRVAMTYRPTCVNA